MLTSLLFFSLAVFAQDPNARQPVLSRGNADLTLDGEVRLRFESRDSAVPYGTSASESNSSGRFRIGLLADLDEEFSAYVQFQKLIRDEGDDSEDFIHQAFFAWKAAVLGTDLAAGRFELDLGSGLLVGTDDWNGTGRAFDGVRADRDGGSYRTTMFWTQPVEKQAIPDGMEQNFGGVWFATPLAQLEWEFYGLVRDDRGVGGAGLDDTTVGARVSGGQDSGFTWSAELATQFGDHGAEDAGGILAAVGGGTHLTRALRGDAGVLYASGDGDPADGNQDAFVPLFDERHSILGAADLVAPSNVIDVFARTLWDLDGNWSLGAAIHWMRLADDAGALPIAGATGTGDSDLAKELDLWAQGRLMQQLDLRLGVAEFWAGDAIALGEDQLWIYAQALVWF